MSHHNGVYTCDWCGSETHNKPEYGEDEHGNLVAVGQWRRHDVTDEDTLHSCSPACAGPMLEADRVAREQAFQTYCEAGVRAPMLVGMRTETGW